MQKELKYKVSFATPAFLGNADQQAQWRTPPFKALIRQWWRVVKARELGYDVARLRAAENALFGTASDDGAEGSHRSLLRLRLSAWDAGKLKDWPAGGQRVQHPEVGDGGRPVDAELYLGYGALEYAKETRSTQLGTSKSSGAKRTAIDEKSSAELRLMCPAEYESDLRSALQLVGWFGTLGSRARNGWGSLQLSETTGAQSAMQSSDAISSYLRPLADCLKLEWPHAIGTDARGPLVWNTSPMANSRDAMRELARLKIAFRTQGAPFPNAKSGDIQSRHVIAYPVTNHVVSAWGNQARLANQIRFKVIKMGMDKHVGVIVHLPCKMPDELVALLRGATIPAELSVWQSVHRVLDDPNNKLTRLA